MPLIRKELAAAGFAPIKQTPGARTRSDGLKAYKAWMTRVLVAPMKTKIAGKPWAADAEAFVDAAMETRFRRSFAENTAAPLAGQARKLIAAGCNDPVVLQLAVTAIGQEKNQWTEARALAAKAREAFRQSDYSKVLGMQLYFQKAKISGAAYEKDREEALLKAAEYIAASLKEDGTWKQEDAPIYVDTIRGAFPSDLCRSKKDALEPLHHPGKFPEWAEETLAGYWEVELGWEGRGDGWASDVSEDGWLKFGEHLTKAEAHLKKAWELDPKQPYAATRLIAVAMAGSSQESMRTWFDRALAAQIDFEQAWLSYSWGLRPRWGGNVQDMRALALAAVETGRYDTDVPWFLIKGLDARKQESDSAEESEDMYKHPAVAAAMIAMCQGYAKAHPGEATHWAWWQALAGWLSGRHAEVRSALAATGTRPIPRAVRYRLSAFRGDELILRGEAALDAAGLLPVWQAAVETYAKPDLAATLAWLDKLSAAPAAAKPMIDRMRRLIQMEQQLEAGEWVKLSIDPALTDWLWLDGPWTGNADGSASITGDGNYGFMVHRARVGPSFEARGTIHCTDVKSHNFCAGIAFTHRPTDGGPGRWMTSELIKVRGNVLARLNKAYYRTGILEKQITTDWSKPVPWTLKLTNDRLTWTVAGGTVCSGQDMSEPRTGVYYRATPNGRLGFCSRITPEDNTIVHSAIEVRRLK